MSVLLVYISLCMYVLYINFLVCITKRFQMTGRQPVPTDMVTGQVLKAG